MIVAGEVLASVLPLIVPATVIAEATYLVARELGSRVEAALLRSLATDRYLIEAPTSTDLLRAAKLVEQYEDLALGATDALVIATAERYGDVRIAHLLSHPAADTGWDSLRPLGRTRR
jgi:predicted nucleic acid-binding protein